MWGKGRGAGHQEPAAREQQRRISPPRQNVDGFGSRVAQQGPSPERGRLDEARQAAARLPGEHDAAAAQVRPALAQGRGYVRVALLADLGGDLVDEHHCPGGEVRIAVVGFIFVEFSK